MDEKANGYCSYREVSPECRDIVKSREEQEGQ